MTGWGDRGRLGMIKGWGVEGLVWTVRVGVWMVGRGDRDGRSTHRGGGHGKKNAEG